MDKRHSIVDLTAEDVNAYVEAQACVDMLRLCGELGGIGKGERPRDYLRRLIDELIHRERVA